MSWRIRIYQTGIIATAGLVMLVLFHWLMTQPSPLDMVKGEVQPWVASMFRRRFTWSGYDLYQRLMLGSLGLGWLIAVVIASLLAIKIPDNIAVRRLAWALALAAAAGTYVTFVTVHAMYRAAIGWEPQGIVRLAFDTLAITAIPAAAILLVRYFMGYPRQILVEEWAEYDLRKHQERVARGGWRAWLYPKQAKFLQIGAAGAERTRAAAAWTYRALLSRGILVTCACIALCVALMDQVVTASPAPALLMLHIVSGTVLPVVSLAMGLGLTLQCLHLHRYHALPEDRDRWAWLEQAIFLIGWFAVLLGPVTFVAMAFANRIGGTFLEQGPPDVLFLAPIIIAVAFIQLAFLFVLALSVFYKGAADPRLAMRKITVFGVLGLILAFVFVLVERTLALQATKLLGLSSESGILIAGAAIAATFGPIRAGTERAMSRHLARWLPLDKVVEGERKTQAVVISDLSGYTQLSSHDEKQAMLVAALFQRQAERLALERNGRVVKSMGDAVLIVFDDASDAAHVLGALPVEFSKAAAQIGVAALPVHSGAHFGDITVTADGDVYGQTVNLAARLQSSAESGQALVSEAFASAANHAGLVPVGARTFKNVAEPIQCFAMQA